MPCVHSNEERTPPPPRGFDLLRIGPIRWLVRLRIFPSLFQLIILGVLVALAIIGWRVVAPAGVEDKNFAKNNLVTLVIWGLWWPVIVWVTVLLGRIWCTICPLEWLSMRFEKRAIRLGWSGFRLPAWIRDGWLVVGLFAGVQMLVGGAHLHRSPAYTSTMIWSLLLLASLCGILFRNRAFCRGFCPVAMLLSVYGRGGILAVRRKSGGESNDPKTGSSCPNLLNPPILSHSRDCQICTHCIKASDGREMTLLLRPPFAREDDRVEQATWPVTLFVMAVSGFVTSEVCSESDAAKAVYLWLPNFITQQLSLKPWANWIEGIWTIFVVPLAIWGFLGSLIHFVGCGAPIGTAWRRLAMPMAIIIAAGHMAKGIAKFALWGGHLPLAAHDPTGAVTTSAIAAKTMSAPAVLLPKLWVMWISLAVLAIGLLLAMRESRLTHTHHSSCMSVATANLAALYAVIIATWTGFSLATALCIAAGLIILVVMFGLFEWFSVEPAEASD